VDIARSHRIADAEKLELSGRIGAFCLRVASDKRFVVNLATIDRVFL
jgi:hypothetical protein